MNKEKQKIVPALRFPTFEKADNWKDVKLIDVTDKNKKWSFTGGPFGSNLKSSDYVEEKEGIRIIQLQNIGDGEFKNDYKIYTSKEKADELLSCNIYPGDIIMSKMGDPVGRACLIPDYHNRYVMSSDGIRIAVDEDKYDKYFIYLVINSKVFRSKVENSSTGSTRKRIGLIDLKKLTLTIPKDKEEQKKIANCLSSLDTLITAETEKLDHLRDHKKGLLQQLFPAKGETKPQYRFSEFVNDGDWSFETVDALSETVTTGGTPSTKKAEYWGGDVRWMNSGELNLKIINEVEGRITREGLKNSSTKIIPENCVLIGLAGQGKTRGTVAINKVKLCINQSIASIFPNKEVFDCNYLYHNLNSRYNELRELSTGGEGRGSLNLKIIKEINVPIPSKLIEQQKIADCFTSLDDLIETQTNKIEALKKHKKGLMQKLFPKVNELAV